MYYYDYNPEEFAPEDIAKDLGLVINDKPGPYIQFYLEDQPVGYVARPGLIVFIEELVEKLIKKKEILI